jgi:hypothetical protein
MRPPRSVTDYLSEQKKSYIKAFQTNLDYPVGVQNPPLCERSFTAMATWKWASPPGINSFIRTIAGNMKEYWVRIPWQGYRTSFLSYLENEEGIKSSLIPRDLEVDHLLNAAFAMRHGLQYVRVDLVPRKFNGDYGWAIERKLTKAEAGSKNQYVLDYVILMKVLNIEPPVNPEDYLRRREQIISHLVSQGVDTKAMVTMGLDEMFRLWDLAK